MSKNTCTAVNTPGYVECQVCFDSWRNPVQVLKCGHIFCQHCTPRIGGRCAICRGDVTATQAPGKDIIAAANAVPVLCSSCGWRGTRGQSETHRCDSKETHTTYSQYPQLSDEEWVRMATGGGAQQPVAVTAGAGGGGPSSSATAPAPAGQYDRQDVFTAIPM